MENSHFVTAIQKEWSKFLSGSSVDPGIVQPHIYDSWIRCRSLGLDPHHFSRKFVSPGELQLKLAAQHNLLVATTRVVRVLFQENAIDGLLVTLYDPEGVLLYSHSAEQSYRLHSLQKGAIVTEEISGTNAVSICLQEKKISETCGAEHYYSTFHNVFCSSVPIWQGEEFQGVLNFTIPLRHFHSYFRNLIKAATLAISEQLYSASLRTTQEEILNALEQGIIIFDKAGAVQVMNDKALACFEGQAVPGHLREIISQPLPRLSLPAPGSQQVTLCSPDNKTALAARLKQTPSGALLILNEDTRKKGTQIAGTRPRFSFEDLMGNSKPHLRMLELAKISAASEITTLITGESGTGKELVAQAIHNASSRANGPFVPVNCGAIPPDLVQSELFGYEEGAFTGANKAGKPGKFELADKGTIFLDEIGEMPLAAQVSLLRVIQSGEVMRIGARSARQIKVRIIAATNKNLPEAIQKKEFRADLFYRLNMLPIEMPALRDRPEDIELLARNFLERLARAHRGQKMEFSQEVLNSMRSYSWPGNIRELENTIARMVFLARGSVIGTDLLPAGLNQCKPPETAKSGFTLEENEANFILQNIRANSGNLRATARALGISRSGLYAKMRRLGISLPEARPKS